MAVKKTVNTEVAEQSEAASEAVLVKAERDAAKAIAEEETVMMKFEIDPSTDENNQYFEHCINGVIYRYPRGVIVEVPKAIAETLERKAWMRKIGVMNVSAFRGAGRQIGM